jgi:hypothetical protein
MLVGVDQQAEEHYQQLINPKKQSLKNKEFLPLLARKDREEGTRVRDNEGAVDAVGTSTDHQTKC